MNIITSKIKAILPHSLLGRSVMILVTPLLIVQIVSLYIFYATHWSTVSRRLSSNLAGEIGAVVELLSTAEHDQKQQERILTIARTQMGLDISYTPGGILTAIQNTRPSDTLDGNLWTALQEWVSRPLWINSDLFLPDVTVTVQLADGTLNISVPRKRLFSPTIYVFVLWMVGTSLLLLGIATIFMRNQVRSVRKLAIAVDGFGKGRDVPDFKPEGATEVRQAATAFNRMRKRIARQIQQRTEMLAGVSHDLRTPLTRMRLQLALMEGADGVTELQDDVTEMQQMVDGYLAFARGEGEEQVVPTALNPLVEDVVGRFRREGHTIAINLGPDVTLPLRPQAMVRVLSNLLGNAVRYGQRVTVQTITPDDQTVSIIFDDDGPGIPPAQRHDVFKAFHRLDPSRNLGTGGVGLGLTIARDITHSHGGDIALETSPLGGLRVVLTLPL